MKTRIRNSVAIVLLTFGVSLPSHAAPTCLAPEPACALVLLGTVVAAVVHDGEAQGIHQLQADPRRATLKPSVDGTGHADDRRRIIPADDPVRGRPAKVPR